MAQIQEVGEKPVLTLGKLVELLEARAEMQGQRVNTVDLQKAID